MSSQICWCWYHCSASWKEALVTAGNLITEAHEGRIMAQTWPLWLQDLGAVNFPPEEYDVEGIKASASTFDELVATLRRQARKANAGEW